MSSFLPYARHTVTEEDIAAVSEILRGEFLTTGPNVDRFESSLASVVGSPGSASCANGTAALHISMLSLGVGPGDAVIVPSLTFAATANCVLYCGGTPVFADIDVKTKCLDVESVREAISLAMRRGLKVKGINTVHYAGLPANIASLSALAKELELFLVEDACHALGARYLASDRKWHQVGDCFDTTEACFSFHPAKHVAAGEGGAVTASDAELVRKLQLLRTHGITRDSSRYERSERSTTEGLANPWYYEMTDLGLNYRLSDVQAALASSQLKRLKANVSSRRSIAERYRAGLQGVDVVTLPPGDQLDAVHAYHLFALDVDFKRLGLTRAQVMANLKEKGIGTQVLYIPVHMHPFYEKRSDMWLSVGLQKTHAHYESTMAIPMYHGMNTADVDRVIEAIRAVLKSP